ncbi:uncharacterized protein HHUB_3517 [Halobacterium hubeiense]|uniref:Uncharacterized protein n=1 Tax=Halobacterium hubeiense TaxID=1407499 RepID=A0A0U5H3D2_9EURY|nr:uncharacterized protein HHUB_3517 [Halobacterium hubeiense]
MTSSDDSDSNLVPLSNWASPTSNVERDFTTLSSHHQELVGSLADATCTPR